MKKVVIASLNPVKAEAVLNGFRRLFPDEVFQIDTCSVSSGVSEQPMSDLAARQGAVNRAQNAMRTLPVSDYWVGIEGGCDYLGSDMVAFAWITIRSTEKMSSARTALFLTRFLAGQIRNRNLVLLVCSPTKLSPAQRYMNRQSLWR